MPSSRCRSTQGCPTQSLMPKAYPSGAAGYDQKMRQSRSLSFPHTASLQSHRRVRQKCDSARAPVPMHGSSLVQVRTEFRWPAPCDSQVAVPCKRPVRKRRQWGEGWLRRPAPNLLPRRVLRWRSRGARPSASASSSLRCSLSMETDRRGAQRPAQHAGMHVVGQSASPSTGGSPRTCGQGSLAAAINQPGRRAEQLRTDGNIYGPVSPVGAALRPPGPPPPAGGRWCILHTRTDITNTSRYSQSHGPRRYAHGRGAAGAYGADPSSHRAVPRCCEMIKSEEVTRLSSERRELFRAFSSRKGGCVWWAYSLVPRVYRGGTCH